MRPPYLLPCISPQICIQLFLTIWKRNFLSSNSYSFITANNITGELPSTFSKLTNMTDLYGFCYCGLHFYTLYGYICIHTSTYIIHLIENLVFPCIYSRIDGTGISGKIPDLIQNWRSVNRM